MRIPVRGPAASTIAMYAELFDQDPGAFDPYDDEDRDLVALIGAWDSRSLTVLPALAPTLVRALTALANGEDEVYEAERRKPRDDGTMNGRNCRDAGRMRMARAACIGLGKAADRVSRL